jgi:uncharacterized protein DUF748
MRMRAARTVALVSLGLVGVYALAGTFLLPPLARHVLVDRASEALGRPVALERVRFNPFTLRSRLEGFRVLEADGKTAFASFDTLEMKASPGSLWHRAPVVDEATLAGLRVHVVRDGETHYNFSDILARLQAGARRGDRKDEEPARFSLANLRIVGAAADFDDRPNGTRHSADHIELALPLVSNLPTHVRHPVQPAFSASIDGSPLVLTGESLPFDPTLRSSFNVRVSAVDVPKYLAYLPSGLPVKVESGKLDAVIAIRFAQGASGDPTIEVAGRASLADVAVSSPEGPMGRLAKLETEVSSFDPLAGTARIASVALTNLAAMQDRYRVASLAARGIEVDLRKQVARIDSIATSDGSVALERAAGQKDTATSDTPASAWNVSVGKADLDGYKVTLVDRAVNPPVTHAMTLAKLEARDLSTANGFKGNATIRARLEHGGSIDASTAFTLQPLDLKGTIEARGIDLTPYRPYVAHFPAVELRSGVASAKGSFSLAGEGTTLRVAYDGEALVDRLATFDRLNHEDLLNWKSVSARGAKLAYAPDRPLRVAIAELAVDGAYSRIVVTPQGKLNVQQLISATESEPHPAVHDAAPRPRDIRIDRITFAASRLNFTDHYIKPNYTADVGELHGSVTKLSSDPASRAVVALQGRWDSSSPVLIAGTVNPLRGDLFLDVAARGQEIDLTKLSAYSQRYAGYGIKEGRLTLDVKYHVEDGKLEGRNRLIVDQLAFGDKVESPDATKLPVLFAVNLLKDKNGRIDLELPISGSLEDPQFEIAAVIGQIFSSRIEKAQTSPFALIAGAAGDKPDELAYVEFEPGSSELTPAAHEKLDRLAALLQDRPGLKLALAARTDDAADVEALQAAARARKLATLPKDAPREAREKIEKEPLEVPAEEREALVKRRDEQVRAYLVAGDRLPEDRVIVAAEPFKAEGIKARVSRVDFALR